MAHGEMTNCDSMRRLDHNGEQVCSMAGSIFGMATIASPSRQRNVLRLGSFHVFGLDEHVQAMKYLACLLEKRLGICIQVGLA